MTAGERLRALAGVSGTAGALLLLLGAGATAGDALVNYSGLSSGTAAQHLLVDKVATPPVAVYGGGGGTYSLGFSILPQQQKSAYQRITLQEEMLLAVIIHAVTNNLLDG